MKASMSQLRARVRAVTRASIATAILSCSTPVHSQSIDLEFPSQDSMTSSGLLGPGGGGVFFISGQDIDETFLGTALSAASESHWVFSMSTCTDPSVVNTFDCLINGVVVGSYDMVFPPAGSGISTVVIDVEFTHAPIAGPDYTLRIVATSTVPPGLCSWNWFPGGTVTLGNGSAGPEFRRGDINDDGGFDISDMVFGLASLFIPGSAPPGCLDAADLNDDGVFDVSDPVSGLAALFIVGTPPPPEPVDCGVDTTPSGLDCGAYTSCP
ncbi:MAG: hypothetical protein KDC38_13955 [Planctomycetes bacterium]|nr:hypothetical protein [Planctomycetota bacterium]